MIVLGLWLAIIGYGIAYSGTIKLGGGQCSVGQAFRGGCTGSAAATASPGGGGVTTLGLRQAVTAQQAASVPTTPIPFAVGSLVQP